jgi:hypothetical protein
MDSNRHLFGTGRQFGMRIKDTVFRLLLKKLWRFYPREKNAKTGS